MDNPALLRIEVDGRTPGVDQLHAMATGGYGHFTAMQVRNHRVRGLDLHLRRLSQANREMFDADLDADRVRDHIRHALGADMPDASVRVLLRWSDVDQAPSTVVVVRPPGTMPTDPWRLQSVPYQRSVAHIKHLGDFGQSYYGRAAERSGYDEALLTGPAGTISEGSITNIGFLDGSAVVWPEPPVLEGISMQLLQPRLPDHGIESHRRPVQLADIAAFTAAFVTNSRGIAAVRQIDDHVFPVDTRLMTVLNDAYDSAPWDQI